MRKVLFKSLACMLPVFALALTARAGSLVNTFDDAFDYVANGIVGDTNWDGVYLRQGDVPGGSEGWGSGQTLIANTTIFPGYLGVQSIFTDWSGGDDDGFFLYKVVKGDFDVSVENVPYNLSGGLGYDNRYYHFAGLLVRAYNPNNSGAPYSPTVPGTENLVQLWRFNEFNIDGQIRIATNGANQELNFGGSNDEINSSRFFRITRVGDVFTFYVKTNASDAWAQVTSGLPSGTLTRSDLAGVPLQVGIAQAAFSDQTRDAVFDNFELSGPGVTFPALPAAPGNLRVTGSNPGGSLTLAWDLGTPGDSSLVVISRRPIQHNPVHGLNYVANAAFGDANTLLGGGGQYVVYNGTGTSVTVTNLGANFINYHVAVYEYRGSGAATVYNTASPATSVLPGPGTIHSATILAPVTSIPVGGAAPLTLLASFSTGETGVDQTVNATWSSSDPSVVSVAPNGAVSGLAVGTAMITATFGSFAPTVTITVRATPTFSDDFGVTQDYIANGLIGSAWDGLFLHLGDIPGGAAGEDGDGRTTVLLAQTNGLSMTSLQSTWQDEGNDGPFLFKVVPGDFQASVHVTSMNNLNFTSVGLMARLFAAADTGPVGGPGPDDAENHVNYWKVQNGATSVRKTEAGFLTTLVGAGPSTANGWLMLQRVNSTNFYFYEKANVGDAWTLVTNTVLEAAAGARMQVGLAQQTLSGVNGIAVLDSFSLDAEGIASPNGTQPPPPATRLTAKLNPDLSMTFTWVAADNLGNPATSLLVMREGGPITAQPTYGLAPGWPAGVFGTGLSLGDGNYVVYRSVAATTNNAVTVTGLTPGRTYYAAVYTFGGTYPDRVFNLNAPATNLLAGTLERVFVGAVPSIPLGGIQVAQVYGVYGGYPVNVSSFSTITVADQNVVQVVDGVFTGLSLGSTTAEAVYAGFTNTVTVTVRPPTFTDNFGVNHDYLAAGVAGTAWDGVYRQPLGVNEVPHSPYTPGAGLGTAAADANLSNPNCLTVAATSDGWENDAVGGFFLFKYVPGDFQAAVHINAFDVASYNQPGLLARAYSTGTNGTTLGAPFVIGPRRTNSANVTIETYGETWVSLTRFDEYGIGTYARRNVDSAVSQNTQPDQGDGNYWLLISREGTEFDFYKRASASDPWMPLPNKTHYSIAQLANAPMQVGLMAGAWWWNAGDNRAVQFDSFMLDTPTGSRLGATVSGNSLTLTWPADPNAKLQYTTVLSPPDWKPVPGTPILGPSGYSLTVPISGAASFFRLAP
ncbi:MAG TPA: Ig-like domain-containing protein [Verrucomicrobiae bacterium]